MTWFSNSADGDRSIQQATKQQNPKDELGSISITCPSCGHSFLHLQDQGGVEELARLPAGVKFDPSDHEILQHLEAKLLMLSSSTHPIHNNHSLIDQFIPTLQAENGICYTHPEKLPGVSKDGQIRHFFHRPSKAYTTGTRKRRKVNTDDQDGSETRWHKTGKTRPFFSDGSIKGFKKILVLYTNYGRQRKPEKTNWVMHQYHLGHNEEEKDGELVVSKVFYQTHPRHCASSTIKDSYLTKSLNPNEDHHHYYNPAAISFTGYDLVVEGDHHGPTSFIRSTSDTSKGQLQRKL